LSSGEFSKVRREAVYFWETRRVIWNLLLFPPTFFAWSFGSGVAQSLQEPQAFGNGVAFLVFGICAIGANTSYCSVYAAEFWYTSTERENWWREEGRSRAFFSGCSWGMILGGVCGVVIARLQYPA